MSRYPIDPVQRFWSKVPKSGADDCWEWTGSRTDEGYGKLYRPTATSSKRSYAVASRFSWELANGPVPAGLFVLHRCDNPPCVNPRHLFVGTQKANVNDAFQKGRLKPPPNPKKTHCKYGHEFNEANTYIAKSGQQVCRACHRQTMKDRRIAAQRARTCL